MKRQYVVCDSYADAAKWAAEYDSKLTATDFKLAVQIIHEDGTVLFYNDAFAVELKQWICVFTEHYSYHVFDRTDVQVREYKRAH